MDFLSLVVSAFNFNAFDGVCIGLSIYLYTKAQYQFKKISFLVMLFFLASDNLAHHFFLDIREAKNNGWIIYWLYSLINFALMMTLWKNKAHLVIILLLAINILLNIVASQYYTSEWMSREVYNQYPYPAAAIMALALLYQWALSNGNRVFDSQTNKSGFVSILFGRCNRYPFGNYDRGLS